MHLHTFVIQIAIWVCSLRSPWRSPLPFSSSLHPVLQVEEYGMTMTRSLHFVLITLLLMMAGGTDLSRYRRYAATLGSIKIWGAVGRLFFVTSCCEVSE